LDRASAEGPAGLISGEALVSAAAAAPAAAPAIAKDLAIALEYLPTLLEKDLVLLSALSIPLRNFSTSASNESLSVRVSAIMSSLPSCPLPYCKQQTIFF
jgi:hypothetical protein